MTRALRVCLVLACASGLSVYAAEPDLSEYRTVENAIKTEIKPATPGGPDTLVRQRPGFLGIHLAADGKGRVLVAEVSAESPAAKAGVQRGDLVLKLDDTEIKDDETFYEQLRAKSAGTEVSLALDRQEKKLTLKATLAPISRPMLKPGERAVLGVQVVPVKDGEGVTIEQVVAGSVAERAKLKAGEVILKIDDVVVASTEKLSEHLGTKKPGDTVTLTLLLAEKPVELKVQLGSDQPSGRGFGGGGFGRRMTYWTKPVYRLGIICIEYPDAKHNEKIPTKAWEESMFSEGTYTKTSATGQTVFGSLRDYYIEQSHGALKVEGKAFDYVEVSKKRAEYNTGPRTAMLTEALDLLLKRDGPDALKDLDGVFFLYAGDRMQVSRGSLFWPHRSNVSHKGKNWAYFICPEGGSRMANISVFCHEFGHMLGLPDLYARPENPGSEGVGIWSAMSNQAGNGKPQHFDAWSKEKLGWIKPTVIDPTVKQKLILAPVNESSKECFKVLVRPDGSEYLLLENRKKKGFDESLPADGLLVWRVVGNRPILQESHGVEGPSGPRVFPTAVPYPSDANDAFTPYTTPSSRSQLGGGLPVHISNIRRLPDGRITFHIGYEYQ